MEAQIDLLKKKLSSIRVSQPSTALISDIFVEESKLKQIASINVLGRDLIVKPWNENLLGSIEKNLKKAGFNAFSQGREIKVTFPPLTEEDRKKLCKNVMKYGEETRIHIRQIRKEKIDKIKHEEKCKESQKKQTAEVDKEVKDYNNKIAEIIEQKKKDIMKV